MEPRADDGDDWAVVALAILSAGAAMEPRADDGDDLHKVGMTQAGIAPQWSPVLMTGTTAQIQT